MWSCFVAVYWYFKGKVNVDYKVRHTQKKKTHTHTHRNLLIVILVFVWFVKVDTPVHQYVKSTLNTGAWPVLKASQTGQSQIGWDMICSVPVRNKSGVTQPLSHTCSCLFALTIILYLKGKKKISLALGSQNWTQLFRFQTSTSCAHMHARFSFIVSSWIAGSLGMAKHEKMVPDLPVYSFKISRSTMLILARSVVEKRKILIRHSWQRHYQSHQWQVTQWWLLYQLAQPLQLLVFLWLV